MKCEVLRRIVEGLSYILTYELPRTYLQKRFLCCIFRMLVSNIFVVKTRKIKRYRRYINFSSSVPTRGWIFDRRSTDLCSYKLSTKNNEQELFARIYDRKTTRTRQIICSWNETLASEQLFGKVW